MRKYVAPLFAGLLVASLGARAQDMRPNKDPVPSPSDLRAERGQDRAEGQAPEARTPSPSDLAVELPRIDGDRWTSGIPSGSSAAGGTSAPAARAPSESNSGPGPQFR